MDEVRCHKFRGKGGHHVGEQHGALGHIGAYKILGCGEYDDVEDIIDQPFSEGKETSCRVSKRA